MSKNRHRGGQQQPQIMRAQPNMPPGVQAVPINLEIDLEKPIALEMLRFIFHMIAQDKQSRTSVLDGIRGNILDLLEKRDAAMREDPRLQQLRLDGSLDNVMAAQKQQLDGLSNFLMGEEVYGEPPQEDDKEVEEKEDAEPKSDIIIT